MATDPARDLGGPSYRDDVAAWHEQRLAIYERFIGDELADGEAGAFLVWGDPALYDSTLRILDQVRERGRVDVRGRGGARHQQRAGARGPVRPTAARRGRAGAHHDGPAAGQGWPEGVDDVVVMLDGSCAFTTVDPAGVTLYWGAYLGTPDEILVSGPLAEVADDVVRVRAEARERKGWMFDTYLLSRRAP